MAIIVCGSWLTEPFAQLMQQLLWLKPTRPSGHSNQVCNVCALEHSYIALNHQQRGSDHFSDQGAWFVSPIRIQNAFIVEALFVPSADVLSFAGLLKLTLPSTLMETSHYSWRVHSWSSLAHSCRRSCISSIVIRSFQRVVTSKAYVSAHKTDTEVSEFLGQ